MDESKLAWVDYWKKLGDIILGAPETTTIYSMSENVCTERCKLGYIQYKIINKKRIFKNNKGKWEPAREAEVIVVKGERTQVMTLIVAEKG